MAIPIIGNIIDRVIDKGASLISEVITDKDQAARLEHEWRQQLSRESHDIAKIEIEAERDLALAQQQTIQAELHQSDLYTKQTRPKIARQSWYGAGAYVAASFVSAAAPVEWAIQAVTVDWAILGVMASPALTYMGVRGLEKWKAGKV